MAVANLYVRFDENIISVQYPDSSIVSKSGGSVAQQTGTFIVNLKDGYVIDTVISAHKEVPDKLTETTFTYNSISSNTITITSKIKEKTLSYDITKSSKYRSLKAGSHTIQIKAKGNGIDKQDSELSSAVTFEKSASLFNITQSLTNVIEGGSDPNPITIFEDSSISMYYKASDNYILPKTITVTGAEFTWSINDKTKVGTCVLSNATDDVVITIVGKENVAKTITLDSVWSYFEVESVDNTSSSQLTLYTENNKANILEVGDIGYEQFSKIINATEISETEVYDLLQSFNVPTSDRYYKINALNYDLLLPIGGRLSTSDGQDLESKPAEIKFSSDLTHDLVLTLLVLSYDSDTDKLYIIEPNYIDVETGEVTIKTDHVFHNGCIALIIPKDSSQE